MTPFSVFNSIHGEIMISTGLSRRVSSTSILLPESLDSCTASNVSRSPSLNLYRIVVVVPLSVKEITNHPSSSVARFDLITVSSVAMADDASSTYNAKIQYPGFLCWISIIHGCPTTCHCPLRASALSSELSVINGGGRMAVLSWHEERDNRSNTPPQYSQRQ